MPLDTGKVGRTPSKPDLPAGLQRQSAQDTDDGSVKHRSRFIRILQDVGNYLANKFRNIKNFFKELVTRDVKTTNDYRYNSPDSGTPFPDLDQKNTINIDNEHSESITSEPEQSEYSTPEVNQNPKTKKKIPLKTKDEDDSREESELELPPVDHSLAQNDKQGETVADRHSSQGFPKQKRARPPRIPKKPPIRYKNTKPDDVEETKKKFGMDAFEAKIDKFGLDNAEYKKKMLWSSHVEDKPPEVKKKSLFSRFLAFLGIKTTSAKTGRVQVTQNIDQHQSNVVNLIKKVQNGGINECPSYTKALTEIDNQKITSAPWLPYIFPRYQDDSTKLGGREYGFTGVEDVAKFSKDDILFTRLIKCSLNITRDSINNGESKAIYYILDAENRQCFRRSLQMFLGFVQSKDCKNKEVLDDIVWRLAKKDCIKFFKDAIEIIDKGSKSIPDG